MELQADGDETLNGESPDLELLLDAIRRASGYDFRQYQRKSLLRRLTNVKTQNNLDNLAQMIPKVLHDETFLDKVLQTLSITVTEFYRNPSFFKAVVREILPTLKSRRTIKVWHAGCSTGEEVYSLAILLREAGLQRRVRIYGTDFNGDALDAAREGIYSHERIRKGTRNYLLAGGQGSLSNYYHAQYGSGKMRKRLKENIIFSHHNLVTDGAFGEMDLIFCRNVLIHFSRELQQKVLALLDSSLVPDGFLSLGSKESLSLSSFQDSYQRVEPTQKIYRRKAGSASSVEKEEIPA